MLKAGSGQAEITPAFGVQIAGNIGHHRPTDEIRNPLYARALAIENDGQRFCLITMDLLAIDHAAADAIRGTVASRFNFDRNAVGVHVTQTHSAPNTGYLMCTDQLPCFKYGKLGWLRAGDASYDPVAIQGAIEAAERAVKHLTPVRVSFGGGFESRVAFNRRYMMRDGTSEMFGGRRPFDILHNEGPIDPELGVMRFTAEDGKDVAMLLHYTSHPTHGYPKTYICPDWCGLWCEQVRKEHMNDGVALVLNGCCGNIHHYNPLDSDRTDTAEHMAQLLTQKTGKVLGTLEEMKDTPLTGAYDVVRLKYRDVPTERITKAKRLLEKHPEPIWLDDAKTLVDWAWVYAATMIDLEAIFQASDGMDYPIQVFRLGDAAVEILGGEPFVEGQLEIKRRSHAKRTFLAHMSNGYFGYVPTPAAIEAGGYETWTTVSSKFAPQSLQQIVDRSVRLINNLFPEGSRKRTDVDRWGSTHPLDRH